MFKYLYSMKTALLLMTAIIAVSIFATFESNVHTYDSYLFKGLLLFLILNLTLCSTRRTTALWAKLRKRSFDNLKKSFSNGSTYKTSDMHLLSPKIINTFRQKGYRTLQFRGNYESIIHLAKGTLSLIANPIIHYALIIIFIGALVSSFGFHGEISGSIGQETALPLKKAGDNLKIRIDGFTTLYNQDRTVNNWETKLTIIEGVTNLTRGRISVNHPFRYRGITFYQSGYQDTCLIELNSNGTKDCYFLPINKPMPLSGRFFIIEKDEFQRYSMILYEGHTIIKTYALNKGTIVAFPNHTALTFLEGKVRTILKVKHDPGIPIVMAGLMMLAIGFILLYPRPYREIKILLNERDQTVQINIVCKSKILNERLTNEVSDLVLGG